MLVIVKSANSDISQPSRVKMQGYARARDFPYAVRA